MRYVGADQLLSHHFKENAFLWLWKSKKISSEGFNILFFIFFTFLNGRVMKFSISQYIKTLKCLLLFRSSKANCGVLWCESVSDVNSGRTTLYQAVKCSLCELGRFSLSKNYSFFYLKLYKMREYAHKCSEIVPHKVYVLLRFFDWVLPDFMK